MVKVGTNVLTRADGRLDLTIISNLVDQLAILKQAGVEVVLVSSGAVGAARSLFSDLHKMNKVVRRQLLSSVGQTRLLQVYQTFLEHHGLFCAQVLATKEDFRDRQHYLNMKNCLLALMRPDILPIINENDVISIDELMFTDNDELAAWIASMVGAEALFVLTNVDGIFTGHPDHPDSELLQSIDPDDASVFQYIAPNKSSFGRGGMATKFRTAQRVAKLGISTYILNGKKWDSLQLLWNGELEKYTQVTAKKDVSNIKKWIAFNERASTGKVYINPGAETALSDPQTVNSLLPVGITTVDGHFEKGDLIELYNAQKELIGKGIAQYDSLLAQERIGKTGHKPLVHYDHLFLE